MSLEKPTSTSERAPITAEDLPARIKPNENGSMEVNYELTPQQIFQHDLNDFGQEVMCKRLHLPEGSSYEDMLSEYEKTLLDK
jgi:hypothetical protein